jgi:hypothetical protein
VTAVQPTLSLKDAWNDVFGNFAGGTPAERVLAQKAAGVERSLLDRARQDVAALKKVLSSEQQAQLDAHEAALRELEGKLFGTTAAAPGATMAADCARPSATATTAEGSDFPTVMQRIADAQAFLLAVMRCGLRRVYGFHIGHTTDADLIRPGLWPNGPDLYLPIRYRNEPNLGYHTQLWHNDGDSAPPTWQPNMEARMNRFFADVLAGMKAIPARGTNLLDQSVALYATTMSMNHSNDGHTFIMAGSGGGRVKTGRVLRSSGRPAHNDVLISTLQALGFGDVQTFGSPELCKGGVVGFV